MAAQNASRVRRDVKVNLDWDEDGKIRPKQVYWHDGRVLDLKIKRVENRASRRVAGVGICYIVDVYHEGKLLSNEPTSLYFEKGANPEVWFVEEICRG